MGKEQENEDDEEIGEMGKLLKDYGPTKETIHDYLENHKDELSDWIHNVDEKRDQI